MILLRLQQIDTKVHLRILSNTEAMNEKDEYKLNDEELKTMLLQVQELERNRISSDLHDTTVQNLTALIRKIEFCVALMDKDLVSAKLELITMKTILRDTIDELRNTIFDLRPPSLTDFGLIDAIKDFCTNLSKSTNIKFVVEHKGNEDYIPNQVKINLYRIVQESVNNTVKHSFAQRTLIKVNISPKKIVLTVQDDGIGVNLDNINPKVNFGVTIMKQRTELLNGKFEIKNNKEGGTFVRASIPLSR